MNKKALFSIAISIALVWYLLAQIEVGTIIKTLKDVPPGLVLLGFAFYALSYLFRALRFKILLQKDMSLGLLFNIVSVHTMWTNILPFRTGELSYLYLLKKKGGTESYMTGVPSLILSRVFDMIAITALFLFSFIGIGTLPKELRIMGFVLIFFVLCLLSLVSFLIWKRERFLGQIKYYIIRFKLDKINLVDKMLGKGAEILKGFQMLESVRDISFAMLSSLLLWASMYICNYILIKAVGVHLNIWQTFYISTFFILIGFLPIHGWAGFGTTEALWVLTVIWFGITREKGIITGFQLHSLALLFSLVLGLVGWGTSNLENKLCTTKCTH